MGTVPALQVPSEVFSRKVLVNMLRCKKFAILGLLVFCAACGGNTYVQTTEQKFASPATIDLVKRHTLSVATIYSMSEQEWYKRVHRNKADKIQGLFNDRSIKINKWQGRTQEIVPINCSILDQDGKTVKFLAYIGSATVIKENHAITVSHLFDHMEGAYGYTIWAFSEYLDHAVECELVVRGNIEENWINDYAVIKLKEDLGLPGLKISHVYASPGDNVIFTGSVGGLAYFTRYGHLTNLQWYFNTGDDGKLHLTPFADVNFLILYPGGPGDSGGSVKNLSGEIVGIMYCGLEVYAESYIFLNPTNFIWQFLQAAGLERLGG